MIFTLIKRKNKISKVLLLQKIQKKVLLIQKKEKETNPYNLKIKFQSNNNLSKSNKVKNKNKFLKSKLLILSNNILYRLKT
jgi:hypothetical protein